MHLVQGETVRDAIDRFHHRHRDDAPEGDDERELSFRRLLRSVIDACIAVAYAHSRGVVHRDLKPANVMLGKFGETLVLDWGLAKAGVGSAAPDRADAPTADPVVPRSSGSDNAGTRAGAVLGTPGYMSPEQAAGRTAEVGPVSDVYSLGVTLHVLLTGRKPSDPTDPAGSDRTAPGTTPAGPRPDTEVPPALVAVCRKAMAVRPADRYPSPLDLAADVERWLADEPVAVFRDPWPVRAGRWGRRHRTAVAAGLVLLVTALAASAIGTGLIWREERETAEQRRVAEENYELARELSWNGLELIAAAEAQFAADPVKHQARKELLVAAAKTFRKHVQVEPDDPDVRRQAARVYRYAANVHRLEREYDAADPLYRDAVELLEGLAAESPDDPAYRLQLCQTLRDQAAVQSTSGRLADAHAALGRVIQLADELLATDPANPDYRRARAAGLLARAGVHNARDRLADAAADAAPAADLFRDLAATPADAHPYDPLLRAAALNLLAISEREAGRPEKAMPLHQEAVKLVDPLVKERRAGLNRADAEHYQTAFRLDQSRTWVRAGRRPNAEKNFGLTAQVWERMAREHPQVPDYQEMAGVAYYERGRLRAEDGRAVEARADFEKSRTILEAEVHRSPGVPALRGALGRTYAALGRLARAAGDRAAAAGWFARAVAALRADVERAPDRARDRRDLQDVEAEAAR
jgi:serine/threonine-protein kinase